jgi:hypothetical protein
MTLEYRIQIQNLTKKTGTEAEPLFPVFSGFTLSYPTIISELLFKTTIRQYFAGLSIEF